MCLKFELRRSDGLFFFGVSEGFVVSNNSSDDLQQTVSTAKTVEMRNTFFASHKSHIFKVASNDGDLLATLSLLDLTVGKTMSAINNHYF